MSSDPRSVSKEEARAWKTGMLPSRPCEYQDPVNADECGLPFSLLLDKTYAS